MKKASVLFLLILSGGIFYLVNRIAHAFESAPGNMIEKMTRALDIVLPGVQQNPFFISTSQTTLIAGAVGVIALWLAVLYNSAGSKNYMQGVEHGSASWGSPTEIDRYMDKKHFDKNMLLSQTERMTLDTWQTQRNNNVLIIGGSGSGKTRFYVKPNLMQMHSSYVVTDPKGSIVKECGKMLADNGYRVKVLNLINMDQSNHYNPFLYIREEKDILKLINNLITNTNSPNSKTAGDFWEKAETALLQALFGFVHFEAAPGERNMGTVMEMLRMAEVREDDEAFKSTLDIMFEDLKAENPNHFACKQYDIYKLAAGKTAKSILVSLGVRLSPFFIKALNDLVADDTIDLDMIGSERTALFVILPDSDKTFNFMAAIMYQQLFDLLFYKADNQYGGRLPYHVRFLLDEFANIGQIPNFETYIATMRGREISVNVVLQNVAQLKGIYKDNWETITGNCDTLLFLGGKEQSTLEYISKMIGKTTIDHKGMSESKGQNASYSLQHQIIARDLITPDEVGRMDGRECIVSIRGEKPFKSRKYDIKRHHRYKLLSDYDKANTYVPGTNEGSSADEFFSTISEVLDMGDLSELNAL